MRQILAHPHGVRASKTPNFSRENVKSDGKKTRPIVGSRVAGDMLEQSAGAAGAGAAAPAGGLGTPCEIRGQSRRDRFALQTVARSALRGEMSPTKKNFRIMNCQRAMGHQSDGSKATAVSILQGPTGARFGGLQTCGSVWLCKVCSDKITRRRECEIQHAMATYHAAGGHCIMVTLTHPHRRADALKPMVEKYAKAVRSMKSWRGFKKLRKEVGYVGEIRALEVTWGESNGFHGHGHELWFIDGKLDEHQIEALRLAIYDEWAKACTRAGLPKPSKKHGVDVAIAWSAAEYMAKFSRDQKWGAGKELTRSHSKRATTDKDEEERFTPFDFLRAIEVGHRPAEMTVLFREYAKAYHGRRQLHWSKGLKKRFGVEEVADQAAAEESEATHEVAGTISRFDWLNRVTTQPSDQRSRLLEAFEKGGMAAVATLVAAMPIRCRYGPARGSETASETMRQ